MSLLNKTIYILAKKLRAIGFNFHEENDRRIIDMKKTIQQIGGGIEFKIEQYPDGIWVAESVNIDGIITGGNNLNAKDETIKDAVFTYFGIPAHLCNNTILRSNNEPVILKQRVYV